MKAHERTKVTIIEQVKELNSNWTMTREIFFGKLILLTDDKYVDEFKLDFFLFSCSNRCSTINKKKQEISKLFIKKLYKSENSFVRIAFLMMINFTPFYFLLNFFTLCVFINILKERFWLKTKKSTQTNIYQTILFMIYEKSTQPTFLINGTIAT